MKVKEKDYEDIYWCIITDQVPSEIINQYFEDRNFYRYYITRRKQNDTKNKHTNILLGTVCRHNENS